MQIRWHKVLFQFILAVLPVNVLLLGYLLQPVTAQGSWKWLAIFAFFYLGLAIFIRMQAYYWIAPLWGRISNTMKTAWCAIAFLLALLSWGLLTPTSQAILEKFPGLAPEERLEIRLLPGQGSKLSVQRVKIGQRQIESRWITLHGDWQSSGYALTTFEPAAYLTLQARVPREVRVVFLRSSEAGKVLVTWGGKEQIIDLYAPENQEVQYIFRYDRPDGAPAMTWIRLLTLPAWFGIALAAMSVLF